MNIACFTHYFAPEIGAPPARIYDLSKEWIAQGHKVEVATCFPNHPTGCIYPGYKAGRYLSETLDGIFVHRHWTYVTPNKGFIKKTLGHVSFYPSALALTNRRVGPVDVSIGTSPTFFAAMAAAALARSRHIPFVMEVRDLWPAIFVELGVLRNRHLIRLLERWELSLYRQATKIVTVTEAFRQNLIERGVPAGKVHTIPNGADVAFWKPAEPPEALRSALGLTGKFVVLYIGAHGISHALGRILACAERLRYHDDVVFLFVGEGAEKAMLVEQAQRQGLANVRFIDPVGKSEVRDYYALADVCLVPLRDVPLFDAFIPSKMFEMMAMGRPIVASVRGEAAEILTRSGGALVVEPEDSAAIARAVMEMHDDRAKIAELGTNGRRFVVDHYSRRALASTYERVLTEAVQAYSGGRQ